MKKPEKYLKFYMHHAKTGVMYPFEGLCMVFKGDELFDLIDPENGNHESFWGDDGFLPYGSIDRGKVFNDLRQNVVLLMAAMNGEL